MRNKNPYTWSGLSLIIAGALISAVAYFIFNLVWLKALGIRMLILSFISFILSALGKAAPKLPPEVCELLLETGVDNIAALIEELGIRTKAIYLPSSLARYWPRAFIPLQSGKPLPEITRALPQRLIARYGTSPEDIGLLISTIGSTATGMLDFEYHAVEEAVRNHPATIALSAAVRQAQAPALIILVSQLNHDAEAVMVATEKLSRRNFTTIPV